MLASYNWIKELSGLDVSPEEVASIFNRVGLEVEGVKEFGAGLDHVVVAEVRSMRPHPSADKLRLVTVFDGEAEAEIVCGAPNVPEPGRKVILAKLGAVLPGDFRIVPRKIRGVESAGMLCSESELGIGEGGEGIFVFDADCEVAPGTALIDALPIRDTIFELGLTPNRPDALGHLGLARELCLALGKPFELPAIELPAARAERPAFEVEIRDADRCPRYGAAFLLGAEVRPSPFWLRYRLYTLGQRSLSNLVDATNLVMLEWGHPIHGFDLQKLEGKKIIVRRAEEGETLEGLDGVERELTEDDLLIADANRGVAYAGVMGGANSEIDESTRDVLIECAYFAPRGVRRTSRRLGIHTDASHRFERGVDPEAVPHVLRRALGLMHELGGGEIVGEWIDKIAKPNVRARIEYRHTRSRALLGYEIELGRAKAILEGVGCAILEANDERLFVEAPSFRPDLTREEDLIEEVARIVGYDAIPTVLPRVRAGEKGTPAPIRFRKRLVRAAAAAGFNQTMSFAFTSPETLKKLRLPEAEIAIENPLSSAQSVMRTSLLPGFMEGASRTRRHGGTRAALFELGRSFHRSDEILPHEEEHLALFLMGEAESEFLVEREVDFFDLKGAIEGLFFDVFGELPTFESEHESPPYMHPRRTARVMLRGEAIGIAGEIHPDLAEEYDLEMRPLYAEFALCSLDRLREIIGDPQAKPLPRFQSSTRDLALVVDESISAASIVEALLEGGAPLAESAVLFDLYRGEGIPEGKKSLAFSIVYRGSEGTLKDSEIDGAHKKAAKLVGSRFGAIIR